MVGMTSTKIMHQIVDSCAKPMELSTKQKYWYNKIKSMDECLAEQLIKFVTEEGTPCEVGGTMLDIPNMHHSALPKIEQKFAPMVGLVCRGHQSILQLESLLNLPFLVEVLDIGRHVFEQSGCAAFLRKSSTMFRIVPQNAIFQKTPMKFGRTRMALGVAMWIHLQNLLTFLQAVAICHDYQKGKQ